MTKTFRIAIIAPVGTDVYNRELIESIEPIKPGDVDIDIFNLPEETSHDCIQGRVDLEHNSYPVVTLAKSLENDYHGIWVSDFDMCGVEAAREVIDIPIIGGFSTSAFTALALSQRFSIITILSSTVGMQRDHITRYGLEAGFASIRSIDCPVSELTPERIMKEVYEQSLAAVMDDGAQSILLGCTGFVGVAQEVSERLTHELGKYVPVIDPNQAGFSFLVSLVRQQLNASRICYNKMALTGNQRRRIIPAVRVGNGLRS